MLNADLACPLWGSVLATACALMLQHEQQSSCQLVVLHRVLISVYLCGLADAICPNACMQGNAQMKPDNMAECLTTLLHFFHRFQRPCVSLLASIQLVHVQNVQSAMQAMMTTLITLP